MATIKHTPELKEYIFKTNTINKTDYFNKNKAVGLLILRLLILEPGKNKLFPNMGLGLCTRKRFILESNLNALELETEEQINTYLPKYRSTSVKYSITNDKRLIVTININNESYEYEIGDDIKSTNITIYTKK